MNIAPDGCEALKSAAPAPTELRANLELRGLIEAGFNSGRTFSVLYRSKPQRNSLLLRLHALANVGLISSDGGLLSNLSLQENILLPVQYHNAMSDQRALQKVCEILSHFGLNQKQVSGFLLQAPAQLSLYQKRLASFVRAMLSEPQLLLCDSIFEGLSTDEMALTSQFDDLFHLHFPFRTSIFLELDHPRGIIRADQTFYLQ